jgi:cytochrome d ubiquinol oxidase subunit II
MGIDVDLATVWAFIIAFAVFAYVVMDGFDLGIGLVFPFMPARKDRDVMMNSVAPVWDGNETWLVLGGGGLFAAFPLAYAVLMPALYTPLIGMLLGLVFRGVAFEFRWRTERWRGVWDIAFIGGSFIAAMCQGIALGAMLQGVVVHGRGYGGGWWDWLTPFSLLTGAAVVIGFALLGSTWLVMKTAGELQDRAMGLARTFAAATLCAIVAVSLATPLLEEAYWERWFDWPNLALTAPVPIAVAVVAFLLFRALAARRDVQPFFLSLALFFLCFVGLGVSIWPNVVPGRISIWEAAAPRSSQVFMLVGVSVLIPMILCYTAYAYWVFRGKVDPEHGYH